MFRDCTSSDARTECSQPFRATTSQHWYEDDPPRRSKVPITQPNWSFISEVATTEWNERSTRLNCQLKRNLLIHLYLRYSNLTGRKIFSNRTDHLLIFCKTTNGWHEISIWCFPRALLVNIYQQKQAPHGDTIYLSMHIIAESELNIFEIT